MITTSSTSNHEDFKRFIMIEINDIEVDKWLDGCNNKCDPGDEYVNNWIKKNAEIFRKHWEISMCKYCKKWNVKLDNGKLCGTRTLSACNNFE